MSKLKPAEGFDSFNEIATIRVELEDIEPLIWRTMEAPTSIVKTKLFETAQDDFANAASPRASRLS